MSDSPGKFLNFLDQLLPFLTVCPTWLRLWVHLLILINFLTVAALAIAYLSSKEKAIDEGSLAYFNILTPTGNQQIPLNDDGAWMLTGTLPKAKGADFDVQILKLPNAQPIPQNGQKIKSTFDGHWSFETAKFDGYGTYEIKATGLLNGQSLVRTVTVTCYDKATVYKLSIEREKQFRTGADIVTLPEGAASPDQVVHDLNGIQQEFLAAYPANRHPASEELQPALAKANHGLDLVDSVLPIAPGNFDLQIFRAFFLKDYAQVLQDLQRPEARQALEEARLMFEAVESQRPLDTNAWNGLGSVYLMNGQPSKALFFIKRSLQLAPDNPFAQQDLITATQLIQSQQQPPADK